MRTMGIVSMRVGARGVGVIVRAAHPLIFADSRGGLHSIQRIIGNNLDKNPRSLQRRLAGNVARSGAFPKWRALGWHFHHSA